MGQSAKSTITIEFGENLIPENLQYKETFEKELRDFHSQTNGKDSNPSITITEFECFEFDVTGAIQLEMYSSRTQNLDFQLELLEAYFDAKIEYDSIDFDSWIQS